jgi:hypothetical protein
MLVMTPWTDVVGDLLAESVKRSVLQPVKGMALLWQVDLSQGDLCWSGCCGLSFFEHNELFWDKQNGKIWHPGWTSLPEAGVALQIAFMCLDERCPIEIEFC